MADLASSRVIRVIADNLKLTVTPRMGHLEEKGVVVTTAQNKVVVRFGQVVFAAMYTIKGWRPLPAMTALAGKKLYSDAEAGASVQALFTAAADEKAQEQGGE